MNAYLVMAFLLMTADGTPVLQPTIAMPWTSIEACEKYLADPARIVVSFPGLRPGNHKFFCVVRRDDEGDPLL